MRTRVLIMMIIPHPEIKSSTSAYKPHTTVAYFLFCPLPYQTMISIAAIIQLASATFPGCSNCKFNLRTEIIDAITIDSDGLGRGENDAYVMLYGVLVRNRAYTPTLFYRTRLPNLGNLSDIPFPPLLKNCKAGTGDGSTTKWGQTFEISNDNTPTWNQELTQTNQPSTYFESTSCLHFDVWDADFGIDEYLFTEFRTVPNSVSDWNTATFGTFASYGSIITSTHPDGLSFRYRLQIWASNCDAGYGNVDMTWYVSKYTPVHRT